MPVDDVVEVWNCVAALDHGLERLRGGFPLSVRLLREIHGVLLSRGRGAQKAPGELRRSQVWIGGTRPGNAPFVPPPPDAVPRCMAGLEEFLHESEQSLPVLVRTGLAHVQFETIHPFLDGNGRVGRLLITLLFCHAGVLQQPLLHLGLYLKQHRDECYRYLDRVRVHHHMQERPLATLQGASKKTELSFPAASKAMSLLEELGIAREITGQKRNRVFAYERYLEILNEEM